MMALDVSADGRALLGVGLDVHSKQLVVLWDISDLRGGAKVSAAPASRPRHYACCLVLSHCMFCSAAAADP
jgi:hypothetical protein